MFLIRLFKSFWCLPKVILLCRKDEMLLLWQIYWLFCRHRYPHDNNPYLFSQTKTVIDYQQQQQQQQQLSTTNYEHFQRDWSEIFSFCIEIVPVVGKSSDWPTTAVATATTTERSNYIEHTLSRFHPREKTKDKKFSSTHFKGKFPQARPST